MADDLHELSALYALDALDGDDRARFEEHLDGCERCRDELAGLQGAAGALAFAVEGPAPPAELRARVLEAAHAESPNVVPLRPAPLGRRLRRRRDRRRGDRRRRRARPLGRLAPPLAVR